MENFVCVDDDLRLSDCVGFPRVDSVKLTALMETDVGMWLSKKIRVNLKKGKLDFKWIKFCYADLVKVIHEDFLI